MNKYENMDGPLIGQLENIPYALVAIIKHPGYTELTIMSNRVIGSTMYKWHDNGNV